MNKDFKVGQRVWSKEYKELATVIDDSYFETCRIKFDDGDEHSVFNIDLHQTADDMFEKLGFEKKIINGVTNYIKELIYVGGQRKIAFYNNSKGYSTTIDRWGEANLSAVTSIPEHQAIHQKLIELGWI